ncbi:hypothetical protein ACFP1I_04060 [Dyadobacter subterraneus]|uniref:Uncharacterized protein n=1 Tax=Dyadobacter subterraneus TaxID=2773304 RepID=A0ABR9WGS2_9BACT|nr:hypothetical protein [Dyadobacter subterraneus]MBE9464696.1 hypothetical protein [Dyadobacter subterraneus]
MILICNVLLAHVGNSLATDVGNVLAIGVGKKGRSWLAKRVTNAGKKADHGWQKGDRWQKGRPQGSPLPIQPLIIFKIV